ncbi:MAG: site-specific integrase [Flavobacteriales bacterium]|nr:site-specific integrase [Flavobacteriales bacterium]
MPSIKPILREDKLKSNGEAPLYVRVIVDRRPKYKSLGVSIPPKYWDPIKEQAKRTFANSVRFNHLVQQKLAEVREAVIESETTNRKNEALDVLRHRSTGFLTYADSFVKRRESINKPGMIKRMRTVVAKVETYLNGKDIILEHLDVKWLNNYEHYLLNHLGNSTNTVASNMSGLRTILNEASREGILQQGRNPFDIYKIRKKEVEIEFLTDEELEKLKNLQLKENSRMCRHRDLFVFASYTAGIRISDLLTLKWKNFDGERLTFTTRKTGQQLNIKLGKTALAIIDSLPENWSKESFIFGLIPETTDLQNDKVVLRHTSSANAYVNKNLGEIAKKAGIEKHLHFHMSRHTWATRMLRRGMRIEHVSKLLGHKSIRTTQVYAKIVNADLDSAIDLFND